MNTTTDSPEQLYRDFCLSNNIPPYSLEDLARKMNITMQRLEFTLETMVNCFPDELKKLHD